MEWKGLIMAIDKDVLDPLLTGRDPEDCLQRKACSTS